MPSSALDKDATLLNSGLFGTHARSASFSTHLSGRFYKNSTLAAHAARKTRAARMRAKKRELDQAILLEERRAELLEERLCERKEQCLRIQRRRQQTALEIQCWIRQRMAMQRVGGIRRHQRAMNQIAVFCQARHRGSKGREVTCMRKREVAQQKREHDASVRIQCAIRVRKARNVVEAERIELRQRRYAGACSIQAFVRERQCRRRYNEMLQERQRQLHLHQQEACTRIQSSHRRNVALQEADRRRAAMKRAAEEPPKPKPKSKRVPLHMRRYSTYSVTQVASIAEAATGSGAIKSRRSSVIGLMTPNLSKQQRRSSCPSVTLAAVIDANNSETKSIECANGSKASVSGQSSSSSSSSSSAAPSDLARQARQRAVARVQERKLKNSNDDRENKVSRTMRNRVAAFENKRKQRLAATKEKFKKKHSSQVEQGCGGGECTTSIGVEEVTDDCCNDIVGEERAPPQALSSEQCCSTNLASPPPPPSRSAATPSEDSFEPHEDSFEPHLVDIGGEPRGTNEKPLIWTKGGSPIHKVVSVSLETGFDAPFEENFIENEDDLGYL